MHGGATSHFLAPKYNDLPAHHLNVPVLAVLGTMYLFKGEIENRCFLG